MRRSIVRRIPRLRATSRFPILGEFPPRHHLTTKRADFFGELQHRLVLLRHVTLKIRDLFLELPDAFVHRDGGGSVRAGALICSSSGITIRL